MKVLVNELADKLKKIKGFIPPKLDIISGILYTNGTLIASNSEITVKTTVISSLIEERFVIPMKAVEYILALPQENEVEITSDGNKIKVKSGKISSTFATVPNDSEYPGEIDTTITEWKTVTPDSSLTLSDKLRKILHCCSVDSSKPIYTGVRFDIDNSEGVVNLVSCDGFRIALTKEKVAPDTHSMSVSAKDIKNILSLEGSNGIQVFQTASKAKFVTDEYEICVLLLAGEFLNYKVAFPKDTPKARLFFDQKTIINCLERALICIGKNKSAITLKTDEEINGISSLHLITKEADSESNEILPAVSSISGEINADFNARFLIDAFKACGEKQISFDYYGKTAPVIIECGDLKQMVLPVRQRGAK